LRAVVKGPRRAPLGGSAAPPARVGMHYCCAGGLRSISIGKLRLSALMHRKKTYKPRKISPAGAYFVSARACADGAALVRRREPCPLVREGGGEVPLPLASWLPHAGQIGPADVGDGEAEVAGMIGADGEQAGEGVEVLIGKQQPDALRRPLE